LDIVVKYCGGCNSQIDRSQVIKEVEALLPARYQFSMNTSRTPFLVGLLVCGCPSACAQKPELTDLAGQWIVIAGKTVNLQELPEDQLAAVVAEKIKETKD